MDEKSKADWLATLFFALFLSVVLGSIAAGVILGEQAGVGDFLRHLYYGVWQ